MSYENARYKNTGNNEGDVLNFFNNHLRNLIQKNGGDNTFSSYTEDFHDKNIVVKIGERTRMMLTHPNHTISQIEKSFIEMEVEFEVGFEKLFYEDNFKARKFTSEGNDYKSNDDDDEFDEPFSVPTHNTSGYIDDAEINQIFIGLKMLLKL